MTISYDHEADVLYITFERSASSSYIYMENENGDVLRLDTDTKRVVGCTIPYFSTRTDGVKITVPEVGEALFSVSAEALVSA